MHTPPPPEGAASRAQVVDALRDGRPARFEGWTFAGGELKGLDLHGCVFAHCRGARADFTGADASEAQFLSCDFNNTLWSGASLSAARFRDCRLTGAVMAQTRSLGLILERSLLVSAQLAGLSFRRERLEGVNFEGADLTEVDFREAVLDGCTFKDANLTRARFEGADLREAEMGPVALGDMPRFRGARISRAQAAMIATGFGLKVG